MCLQKYNTETHILFLVFRIIETNPYMEKMCYNDSTAAINMQGYAPDLQYSYTSHSIYNTHTFLTAFTALIHFSQDLQHP